MLGSHLLVRGTTWPERMHWCATQLDWLRRLLLREPCGHPSMCAVLVLPPLDPSADVGIIVLEQGGFRPMSGSNTMCALTALLETGSLPATEPETIVRIDTAVGPVEATARVEAGRRAKSFLLVSGCLTDSRLVGPGERAAWCAG